MWEPIERLIGLVRGEKPASATGVSLNLAMNNVTGPSSIVTPEPSAIVMSGIGCLMGAGYYWRRNRHDSTSA